MRVKNTMLENCEFIIKDGVLETYRGDEENVLVPDSVHTIGRRAFYENLTIKNLHLPGTVTKIDARAFECCSFLETVTFPSKLETIERSAFLQCKSLENVDLPNTVVKIGMSAFCHCENLISVKLPDKLKSIEDNTFSNCTSLLSIVIPDTVENIGEGAFRFCKSLAEIQMSDSVQTHNSTFEDTPWLDQYLHKNGVLILGNKLIAASERLTTYEIPNNVQTIASFAFYKSNIKELSIPENVTEIENYAFSLSNIKYIYLPQKLKKTREWTFAKCRKLEELTISKNVEEIGDCALYDLPNCIVTILNDDKETKLITDDPFGRRKHTAHVKEVRVHRGSRAAHAAKSAKLLYTYL